MKEESLLSVLQASSVAAAGLFAGGALAVSLVDVPARKALTTRESITYFHSSFYKVAGLQIAYAVVSGASGLWAAKILRSSDVNQAKTFLWGGIAILFVLPYTGVVMSPTLKYLLDPNVDKESKQTADSLDTWAKMHLVRTAASCIALVAFLRGTFS